MLVDDGVILKVVQLSSGLNAARKEAAVKQHAGKMHRELQTIYDFSQAVVSPGLADLHVHMDEPGREHWEGELSLHAHKPQLFSNIASINLSGVYYSHTWQPTLMSEALCCKWL